jgi:peptidyl-prolyl cis-trans isomerase C
LARADTQTLARVGPFAIDVGSFQERAALLAPFQWATLGNTWEERRRRLLDEVLIPEALLQAHAGGTKGDLLAPRDAALSEVLLLDLQAQVSSVPVSDLELRRHYEQHRRHYETPRAILIWRILRTNEPEARELIAKLGVPDEAEFRRLARDLSIDEATCMRAGTLGYVASDGQTHMPQVRVSPALFAAADQVRDGQLVPVPVREGDHFAVVWRRTSRPAQAQSWAEVSAAVRAQLEEQKLAEATRQLLERLRANQLRDFQPGALAGFEPRSAEPVARPALAQEAVPLRPVRLLPKATDRGLR